MPRRDTWSDDELLVVLDLYLRRGRVPPDDIELVHLSQLTGRTCDAIAMRIANYRHSDPSTEVLGLDAGGKAVQRIWDEYANDPDHLKQALAKAIPRLEQTAANRLKDASHPTDQSAYLITWNPMYWPWDGLAEDARAVMAGQPLELGTGRNRWSVTTTKIRPGDRLFLVRVGKNPKGIVGSAVAASGVYTDADWGGKPGETKEYIDLTWDALLAPDQPPLALKILDSEVDPSYRWTPQRSGQKIPSGTWERLEVHWAQHLGSPMPVLTSPAKRDVQESAAPFTEGDVTEDLFFEHQAVLGWFGTSKNQEEPDPSRTTRCRKNLDREAAGLWLDWFEGRPSGRVAPVSPELQLRGLRSGLATDEVRFRASARTFRAVLPFGGIGALQALRSGD